MGVAGQSTEEEHLKIPQPLKRKGDGEGSFIDARWSFQPPEWETGVVTNCPSL